MLTVPLRSRASNLHIKFLNGTVLAAPFFLDVLYVCPTAYGYDKMTNRRQVFNAVGGFDILFYFISIESTVRLPSMTVIETS